MKDLLRTLLIGGALSVLAGGAIANQTEDLHCKQAKCVFDGELEPSQTKTFSGYCDGYPNNATNSGMVCHAATGMVCDPSKFGQHWQCTCTNWATKKQPATIDVYCIGPNQ